MQIDPFSTRPDPAFYYRFTSFEQRLHILQRLIQGQDFIILVIGKAGSGKTLLLNRFLESTDENWRTCRIRTRLSSPSGHRPSLENLDRHPAYILQENRVPIVMFDDAHRLNQNELTYLLQDALTPGSQRKLKRLVLFSEPQILAAMENISKTISSKTAINKIFMPAITRAETAAYLWHRLSTAGFRGKNPFNSAAVKTIYSASDGLPGRINEAARKYLQGTLTSKNSLMNLIDSRGTFTKRTWIWLGAGLVAVGLVFWVTRPDTAGPIARTAQPDTPVRERIVKKKIDGDTSKPAAERRSAGSKQTIKSPAKPASTAVTKQTASSQSVAQPTESIQQIAPVNPEKAELPQPGQKRIYREKWLLRQNPSFYTIQIMGSKNEQALRNYVQTHHQQYRGPLAYYQTVHKGNKWYPLLYGVYPSRKQAVAAQQSLPEDIQRLSPWIRKLSTVQRVIKESKK